MQLIHAFSTLAVGDNQFQAFQKFMVSTAKRLYQPFIGGQPRGFYDLTMFISCFRNETKGGKMYLVYFETSIVASYESLQGG